MDRTYPAGVTSWVDVETPDVDAAAAFYGAVLGWSSHDATPPGVEPRYAIAQVGGQDVAGIGRAADGATPTWHTYVAVDDVGVTLERVRAAGGTVTDVPTVAGEGGTWAGFTDPGGAALRLWQPGRRLGAQVTNAPGTWNFSDLHAADAATAQEFYGQVFGWTFADVGFATMIGVPGYGDHLAATTDPDIHERQSGVGVPPGFADAIGWLVPVADGARPHWHVTFAVADRDATVELVVAHGGEVLASDTNEWARTAEVCDPAGAVLTLSQFAPQGG